MVGSIPHPDETQITQDKCTRSRFGGMRRSRPARILKFIARCLDDAWHYVRRQLFPRERRSVLFEVSNPFGFNAQAPVIRELISRGRISVCIFSVRMASTALSELLGVHDIDPSCVIKPAGVRHRRFDLTVITDSAALNVWRTRKRLYIHHGSSFGNLPDSFAMHMIDEGAADIVCCLAQAEVELLCAKLGESYRSRLVVTGAPKLDALIAGEYDRSRFLGSLGLDPALKTVLIWSHWTSHSLFRSSELREFASFLSRQNINVIVSAHFHLFDQANTHFSGGVNWWRELTELFTGPRVRVLSRVSDNRELLWAADVLVGDHSSLHVEFAVLRRPMAIYVNAETPLGDRYLQGLLEETALTFSDITQAPMLIARALENAGIAEESRDRFLNYCFDYIGTSAKRIADTIERSVGIGGQTD